MNSIAYCGHTCCVCAQNKSCPGCQNGGCDIHGWCKNYNCCREKGLDGCWECADFPCKGSMLDKPRIRAFAHFAKEYGADMLIKCLLRNKENGNLATTLGYKFSILKDWIYDLIDYYIDEIAGIIR